MPQAWLACFGRTLAGQVLDGVAERMKAPRAAELYVVEVEVQLTVCRASQRVGENRVCCVEAVRWNQYGATLTSVTRNGS